MDESLRFSSLVIEAVISLVLDVGVLASELAINVWLACSLLYSHGISFYSTVTTLEHYYLTICLVMTPSVINVLIWSRLSRYYENSIGFLPMFTAVFIGLPSSILV